jgi:HPt (histidine-containing phosphotransfer) domain-containing protein
LTPSGNEIKELKLLFQRRLQDDLLKLRSLASRFASADAAPATVLEEIRFFAHRLQGAAAIFEAQELARSAQALEAAAALAVTGCALNTPPSVSSALKSLLGELTTRVAPSS